ELEFTRVLTVRVDARVGAERDAYARLHGAREIGAHGGARLLRLGDRPIGQEALVGVGQDGFAGETRRHQERAALLHEAQSVLVDVGAVLDARDPGAHRGPDALGA